MLEDFCANVFKWAERCVRTKFSLNFSIFTIIIIITLHYLVWQNPSKVGQISTKLVIFVVRLALQHGKWFVDDFSYLVCKYHKTEIVHCGDSFIFWYYNQLLNDGNHMCTKFPWSIISISGPLMRGAYWTRNENWRLESPF